MHSFSYLEGWTLKNWCFWTVVLEKTLESPLDCKEIQPIHSEDQPWDFFGRNDAEAEAPVLWPPRVKSWLIGKDSDAGRDWGQEEKGTTQDEMASLTRWTWVWVNSGRWWCTGRPGVLRFMGSQRVGQDWATELNWTSKEIPGLVSFKMDWLDLLAVQGTLKCLFQHHSSKASILRCSAFFTVQLSHPYMTTGKTISLTRRTLLGKVMSLLLNMLSRLVITFLPRSKCLLISWLQSPSAVILEPKK